MSLILKNKLTQEIEELLDAYENKIQSLQPQTQTNSTQAHPWLILFVQSMKTQYQSLSLSAPTFREKRKKQALILKELKTFERSLQFSYIQQTKNFTIPQWLKKQKDESYLQKIHRLFHLLLNNQDNCLLRYFIRNTDRGLDYYQKLLIELENLEKGTNSQSDIQELYMIHASLKSNMRWITK